MPDLQLSTQDKYELQRKGTWLTSDHMNVAMTLLKRQDCMTQAVYQYEISMEIG